MRRYETRSTIMTSNRPLEDWGKLVGDVPSATAILDRFLHHAELISITGRSYRLRNRADDVEPGSEIPGEKPTRKGSPPGKQTPPQERPPSGNEDQPQSDPGSDKDSDKPKNKRRSTNQDHGTDTPAEDNDS